MLTASAPGSNSGGGSASGGITARFRAAAAVFSATNSAAIPQWLLQHNANDRAHSSTDADDTAAVRGVEGEGSEAAAPGPRLSSRQSNKVPQLSQFAHAVENFVHSFAGYCVAT